MAVKVCVYAICKNELKFVDKWLDNMQEADYICVLDTGSTDGTYERLCQDPRVTVVKQQVIRPWRFDVARNESMKLVPEDADVLVCTDFDELFTPGWANIVRNVWNGSYNRVFYSYAWSHTEEGERTDIFKYDKMHDRNFKWKFPVHEVLWPIDETKEIRVVDVGEDIYLDHYPDQSKERHYYFDLLKLSVEENPEDSHVRMLLAREYLLNEDYDNALKNYEALLQMKDVTLPEKKLVLLEAIGRCADIYKLKKDFNTSILYCQEFIKQDYTYREPYLIMADIYNELELYTLAEACVLQALKYSNRKFTWVERANTWTDLPADILSIAYYKLNNIDEAIKYVKEALSHHPSDVRLLRNYNVFLQDKIAQNEKKIDELTNK